MAIEFDVNYADEFVKEYEARRKGYPDTIHLMVKRYKKWKKRDDIFFDNDKANHMLAFTETFCKHTAGDWAGKPLILQNWQKFYFANIYGWQKWSDQWQRNIRVITRSYLQVPKKQGKSLMESAPLAYSIYAEGIKGGQYYILAADFEQAQNVAQPLASMIENDPDLAENTFIYRKEKEVTTIDFSFIDEDGIKHSNRVKVLTKDDKVDGKNSVVVVCDEVHDWKDTQRYDGLKSGQGSQAEPLLLVCSTAGKNSGALGAQIYADSKDILENDNDDSWLILITEPNKGYDWEDREVWAMVNINLGVSITMDFLEGEFKDAQRNPFRKAEFLSKHLNVFVNYAETYFSKEQIDACLVDNLGEIEGYQVSVGIDLSKTTDLTCVSFNIPTYDDNGNNVLKIKQMYFIPDVNLDEKEKIRNVPYRHYAKLGFVTICEGRTIDYDLVFNYVMDHLDFFDISQINYDPAMSEKLVERFELMGLNCAEVGQYPNVMNDPFDDFEILIDQGRVQTDNPLFIFCCSNAKVITNIQGEKVPSKRKSPEHIDGFVAFLIGHKDSMNLMDDVGDEDSYKEMIEKYYGKKK